MPFLHGLFPSKLTLTVIIMYLLFQIYSKRTKLSGIIDFLFLCRVKREKLLRKSITVRPAGLFFDAAIYYGDSPCYPAESRSY